jgi:tetratricopeptide (TPR) repeat protein
VASWDKEPGDFGDLKVTTQTDALSDAETMEQLVELGYVEKLDEKFEVAIKKTRIDLKHNLARVYMGKKDFASSKTLLLELLEETPPIDLAPYYMNLISIAVIEKEFMLAKEYLQKVKDSKTEVNYNLHLTESYILSEIGRPREALAVLDKSDIVSGQILYKKATLNFVMGNIKQATQQLQMAIEKEPEKPNYYTLMAEILLQKEQYEEAVEYALTSIEIVKYFPKAHLVLGQALEKLGDFENAKTAYEMANSLKPKEFHKAKQSLDNIIKKETLNIDYTAEVSNVYHENQVTIVSGLPRSGTSLMMQMLDKGGVEILQDQLREADISNPKGYYEYKPVMSLYKDNSWLSKGQDKAVKVVAPLLKYLDSTLRYKIIFMRRDLNEIIQSQQKMIGKSEQEFPVTLYNKYQKLLANVTLWDKSEPGVEILYVNYTDVLENPATELVRIEKFLGIAVDVDQMINCVDVSLYRNRIKAKK